MSFTISIVIFDAEQVYLTQLSRLRELQQTLIHKPFKNQSFKNSKHNPLTLNPWHQIYPVKEYLKLC